MPTEIEWTDETLNAVLGCSDASDGCKFCYAKKLAATRLKHLPQYKGLAVVTDNGNYQWTGRTRLVKEQLDKLFTWRKPRKIFLTSMGDPFHKNVSVEDIDLLFTYMRAVPHHTFQLLTKRPERMLEYLTDPEMPSRVEECGENLAGEIGACHINEDGPWPCKNIWLGTSVENQKVAEERIPILVRVPAAIRFISFEPLLENIDLGLDPDGTGNQWGLLTCPRCRGYGMHITGHTEGGHELGKPCPGCNGTGVALDWGIIGGESGDHARPFDLAWARSLVSQLQQSSVATFVKQLGAYPVDSRLGWPMSPTTRLDNITGKGGDMAKWPQELRVREFPEVAV